MDASEDAGGVGGCDCVLDNEAEEDDEEEKNDEEDAEEGAEEDE